MTTFDIYARVSRTGGREGKDNFWSPTEQVEKCEQLAALKGFQVGETVTDLDASGKTMDRPEFQRLVTRVEGGESAGLIVARLDRFGRTNVGIWQTVERIRAAGGAVLSVSESLDTRNDSPMGNAMLGMLAVMAQWQLDNLTAGWNSVHERNVAMGVPNRAPWGYHRANGKGSTILPTAIGREWVPRIFHHRKAGKSPQQIADVLNTARVPSPTGGQWGDSTVKRILDNRVYRGECRYGDLVNREAWEPLVSEAEFLAVQFAPITQVRNAKGLVTGLIRCASCRYALTVQKGGDSYACTHAGCPGPVYASVARVDEWVENHLREAAERETAGLAISGDTPQLEDALEALEEARAALQLFQANRTAIRLLGVDEWNRQLGLYVRDVEDAERTVGVSQAVTALPVFDSYSALGLAERREIVATAVGCIFLRGRPGMGRRVPVDGRLHVLTHDEVPENLPVRGYARYTIQPWVFPEN